MFHVSLRSKQNDKEAEDPGAQAREEERKHVTGRKDMDRAFIRRGQAMLQVLLNESLGTLVI